MNPKAMEAAKVITDTYLILSHNSHDIGEITKEIAGIISKHFPEPSVAEYNASLPRPTEADLAKMHGESLARLNSRTAKT